MPTIHETPCLSSYLSHSRRLACLLLSLAAASVLGETKTPLRADGVIAPHHEVELAASSDGVIVEIPVQEGQEVAEGQVLARMQANKETAEAEYYKQLFEIRSADIAPSKKLFQDGVLSKEKWDEKLMDFKQAETTYKVAQQKLDDKTIKAPVAGVILRRYKDCGESIKNLEPFMRIVSINKLYANAFLEGKTLSRVTRGQRAKIIVPSHDNATFEGVVEIVDPVIDRASGTFRVKILLENPNRQIPSGAACTVELVEAAKP